MKPRRLTLCRCCNRTIVPAPIQAAMRTIRYGSGENTIPVLNQIRISTAIRVRQDPTHVTQPIKMKDGGKQACARTSDRSMFFPC